MICHQYMYEAFKKSIAEASDSETQADVYKNAIEAAIEAQQPWDRFLEARTACLHAFHKEGKPMDQIAQELSFTDVDHAKRVYMATLNRKEFV